MTSSPSTLTSPAGVHDGGAPLPGTGPGEGGAVPLSVLDLVGVGVGVSPGQALRESADLAVLTESLGYRRFWVAEHHGMPAVASAAPAVVLAAIGARTSTIRLGSGGVMLPNHAPLTVAEQFGTLDNLYPGRVDLGLGRAPGTDQLTAYALRRRMTEDGDDPRHDDFADRLTELQHFLGRDFPADHPFGRIRVTPAVTGTLPVWLLGSSDYSARLAGRLGMPFAFAHHFAGAGGATEMALDVYRRSFRPSATLAEPYSMIGVTTLAADDEATARYESMAGALSMVLLRTGRLQEVPTPAQAAAYPYSAAELDLVRSMQATEVTGTPDAVATGLADLVSRMGVNELMISTRVHGAQARHRSFELVAGAWARQQRRAA
ncbi:LLM class flavin-dependent oxidoreductase [Nakamurella flavida]|uniref:LLM class flavin-dependent oxidoreductase n=1 Tax=Nakamurella flavida TaxID=363630 RepID=A0A938YKS0_9ACTN|nr:LLM class flavin-dependent oxidoreductase [Nakamurella flavida]MBM9474833.1 LLM class flavin-dependent oxidoreductase [Nakamurella flavida]MDP9776403.1 luciferase family oxidoreductase group 1 [Nakamurella flavida]